MKLLFLGDSITEGIGASAKEKNYVNLVKSSLGCETVNYGVSGTRIGRQTQVYCGNTIWNYDFRLRAQIMDSEADKVFVFGGTNDYGHGSLHLGKINERIPETFCTELRILIEDLIQKYGEKKLCFLLPLRRYNDEKGIACKGKSGGEIGENLFEYVKAMKSIISEYGIDFIDLYENGIPKPLVSTGDEYTLDGVHPNDKGYDLLASIICEYINKKGDI